MAGAVSYSHNVRSTLSRNTYRWSWASAEYGRSKLAELLHFIHSMYNISVQFIVCMKVR